jgi:uncharacterized repeat protein (TIGR01451 family)
VDQIVTCDYRSTIKASTSAPVISLVVAVGSSAALLGTVTNTVEVTPGATGDPNLSNNIAHDPTLIVGADLSITKSHTGDFVAGGDGTYTLLASNGGPAASAGPITVVDTLPTGESYVSADGTGWTCSADAAVVTCTSASGIPAGSAGSPITLRVAVGSDVTGTLTNTAEVVPGPTADPSLANNTTTDPTAVTSESDLGIVKSHKSAFALGKSGSYALTVSNEGPSTSRKSITVTDPLPLGETFVSAVGSGWTCADATKAQGRQTVTCTLPGTLGASSYAPPIALTVKIGLSAYPRVTNTASVTSLTFDPYPKNNSSSDPVTPTPIAAVTLRKRLEGTLVSGADAAYVLQVANAGPSPAAHVQVTDRLPAGLTAAGASGALWRCHTSGANSVVTCDRVSLGVHETSEIVLNTYVDARAGASIVNHATVTTATETTEHTKQSASSAAATVLASHKASSATTSRNAAPTLAFTGLDFVPISIGGLLLVIVGASLVLGSRRRRTGS